VAFEIPMMMVAGRLALRLGHTGAILAAAAVYALFMLLFPHVAGSWALWLLAPVAGASAGVVLSLPMGYLQELLADRPGAGGSLIAYVNFGAQLVAAGLFSAGLALGGHAMIGLLGGLVPLGAAALLWQMDRGAGPGPLTGQHQRP